MADSRRSGERARATRRISARRSRWRSSARRSGRRPDSATGSAGGASVRPSRSCGVRLRRGHHRRHRRDQRVLWPCSHRSWTGLAAAVLALLIAAGTAAVPLDMRRAAASVPVHPRHHHGHRAARPSSSPCARCASASPNGAAYGGPAVAAEQKQGYPDIVPVLLPFRRTAPSLGSRRSPAPSAGRSLRPRPRRGGSKPRTRPGGSASRTTSSCAWLRRLDGSRVDIRSVSRVGRSDLGVNAKRIRAFLGALSR